jgi:hypothetical protein
MSRHLLRPRLKMLLHRRSRRTTAVVPTSLTGLVLWQNFTDITKLFKDTAAATPVTANGDIILRINDSSTSANNATQATSGKGPLWQSDGNGALFDGVDDVLAAGNTGLNINTKTVIVAWTPVALPTGTHCIWGASASNYYYMGHSGSTSCLSNWFSSTPTQKNQIATLCYAVNVHSVNITTWDVSGSNVTVMQRAFGGARGSTLYVDGMTTPGSTAYYTGALVAAGTSGINGKIRHVLVYNRVLTPVEMAGLESYLAPP